MSVLFRIWGAVTWLLRLSLLATGLAATASGSAAGQATSGGPLAAGIVAAAFFVVAAVGFIYGALHVLLGSRIRRRVEWARPAAIILAFVDVFVPPLGTALGVYALWALFRDGTAELFDGGHAG